jgi:hypothetical protein
MQKRILCYAVACLLSVSLFSQVTTTVTSNNQLWDLRLDNATDMSASDDGTSQVFNFGFDFNFFGETFSQGYMASNGCLILGSLSTADTWEKNCTQYNPSPSPNTNYTMYPFWTDLIMGENSSMLAKSFDDKIIFGWYEMWEYYRDSKNTFELWLYPNNTYEAIYGQLDIQDHDVFIGIQGNEQELETYYFHDECNTGIINSTTCVNQDWNNIGENQTLENGGSIFVGEVVDCSNPLNDTSCSGYADAYQTQQCDIDQLYSEACPYYWDAYDDLQCNLDPQYGPFCQGYSQEQDIGYFQEEEHFEYGYEEEQFGYEEEFVFEFDEQNFQEPEVMFEEDIIFEQMFPQEEVYEYFEPIQEFRTPEEELFMPVEELLIDEFIFQETFLVEDYREPNTFIELETIEQLEEWFEEETRIEEELADLEEPEEEFIEEIFEEEVVEEVFEAIEERIAESEIEEERIEREETTDELKETFEEEFLIAEKENIKGESSISREIAMKIVSSTMTTAQKSMRGTTAGTSVHSTGNSVASGGAGTSSNSGISTTSSPSLSDQFASATQQTNQVLSMSVQPETSGTSSITVTPMSTIDDTTSVAVVDVQVQNIQGEIDTASSGVMTTSEADKIANKIVAANIEAQQEEIQQEQQKTGEYGDESKLIALIGYLPAFDQYQTVSIPDQEKWYSERIIYTKILNDNTQAFYSLAGQNIATLNKMKDLQPTL